MNLENLELKKLNKNGLKTLVGWAKKEGWNPGEHDFDVFWKTDPDGYYGFYSENELIAGGAVISYNQEFGFMGLFIVHPDFRGQGIGKKLWYLRRDLLLGRLKDGAAIGMDGVVDMQPFYEKGGFNIAFRDERYECVGQKTSVSSAVSTIEAEDFGKLADYDLECFGYKREAFLKHWLMLPDSKSYKFSENNEIKGFAVIRKVNSGFKIGPLFADHDAIAEALYKACLNSAIGASVYLDIPVINKGAMDLVKTYNAKYVFECARMYYGKPPKTAIDKVYGITTFELG
ncbi:GNAT family N-acetyltransferase [Seonamhaeicola sp.]|uniref:GNAT family N-acetyltransferase n=1 Tax=Seonamhaeicola sp. TaxID=1912245 RepID=UPI00262E59E3|nr:GNAT family N-acetyltransferase [Seonamhaeicola sp.]